MDAKDVSVMSDMEWTMTGSATHKIVCGQSQRHCTYLTMGHWLVIPVRMVPRRETINAGVYGPLVRVGRVRLVVPCLALVSVLGHGGNGRGRTEWALDDECQLGRFRVVVCSKGQVLSHCT